MEFKRDGFCEELPAQIDAEVVNQHGDNLQAAYDLNRSAMQLMHMIDARNHESIQIAFLSMYLRGLMHFQSSLLLLKAGARQSVKPLLRLQLEITFRLVAVSKDSLFYNRLIDDELIAVQSRARAVKRHKESLGVQDSQYNEAMDALRRLKGKGKKVIVRDVADAADMIAWYDTSYVAISDSVHSSFLSLEEGLETNDGTGLVESVDFHRSYIELEKSIYLGMLSTVFSCIATADFFSIQIPEGVVKARQYLIQANYIDA